MNWIDLILAVVFLLAVIAGWYRGFIMGALDLGTWVGSLVLGYLFYPYAAKWIDTLFNLGAWLLPVSFILTTILARILIGIVVRLILSLIPHHANHNGVNRFLGIIPGAINGGIAVIIISALLLALPIRNAITEETRESQFAPQLAMQAEWANRKLAPVFDEAIRQTMNSLTVRPDSDESVDLNFTYNKAVARPNLEAEMLELVNKERIKAGLNPVKADPEMTRVARVHSQDMFVRGYFAHVNPDGKDPFDRMRDFNIRFMTAGENLALAQTVGIAHNNLMNSPGHRANILNPNFGRLGIGIMDGGFYGLMISQEFRD